jgi:small subunit ribosomal protein S8e
MGISRDKAHKRRSTGGRVKRIRMKRKFEMGRQPSNTKIGDKKVSRIRVRGGNYKFRALRLDHGNFAWAGESVTRKTRILKVVYNSTNNELVRTNTLVKGSIIQIDSTPFKAWYLQYYNVDLSNKKSSTEAKAKPTAGKKEALKKEEKTTGKKDTTKKDEKSAKKDTTKKDDKSAKKDTTKKDTTKKDTTKKDTTKKDDKVAQKDKPKTAEKAKGSKGKGPKKQEETERTDLNKKALAKFVKRNSTRKLDPALIDQFKTGRVYAKISSRPGQSGRCDGYIVEGEELAFYLKKINLKKKK